MTAPDFAVLFVSLSALVAIGMRFRKEQTTTADFFLARRSLPGWAAGLSFVAAEVSALTIVSVPATAYRENWEYAQFFIGSALAQLPQSVKLLP